MKLRQCTQCTQEYGKFSKSCISESSRKYTFYNICFMHLKKNKCFFYTVLRYTIMLVLFLLFFVQTIASIYWLDSVSLVMLMKSLLINAFSLLPLKSECAFFNEILNKIVIRKTFRRKTFCILGTLYIDARKWCADAVGLNELNPYIEKIQNELLYIDKMMIIIRLEFQFSDFSSLLPQTQFYVFYGMESLIHLRLHSTQI